MSSACIDADLVEVVRVPRVVVPLDQLALAAFIGRVHVEQHALVADAPCESVCVEALEQQLRRLRPTPSGRESARA